MHWIPLKQRNELLLQIIDIIGKQSSSREKTRLTYGLLLKPKYRAALKGIRRYHLSRITNLKAIPSDQWPKVLKLRQFKPDIKINDLTMEWIMKNYVDK